MNNILKTDFLSRIFMAIIVLGIIYWIGANFFPEMRKNKALREKIIQLNQNIQNEESLAKELRNTIDALRNDPKTVERLLRENGYAKPGETVFKFESANIK
ncbi:MAG: FtsB family cell division protein [Verrucomicrobiia bacterium]|jgi:cell division protein FtsB